MLFVVLVLVSHLRWDDVLFVESPRVGLWKCDEMWNVESYL